MALYCVAASSGMEPVAITMLWSTMKWWSTHWQWNWVPSHQMGQVSNKPVFFIIATYQVRPSLLWMRHSLLKFANSRKDCTKQSLIKNAYNLVVWFCHRTIFVCLLFSSDVYSYDEDDMVEDPHLAKHLAHFGIDIMKMEKVWPDEFLFSRWLNGNVESKSCHRVRCL